MTWKQILTRIRATHPLPAIRDNYNEYDCYKLIDASKPTLWEIVCNFFSSRKS